MSLARYRSLWVINIIVANCWLHQAKFLAQAPVNPATLAPVISVTSKPAPVVSKSPVAIFRQLLAMTGEEQEKFLADKTPEDKDEILAKVSKYKALKPDEREMKLKATELRWYLRPFMSAPETNRAALLANVPEKDRKLVEDRLHYWDKLPLAAKKQLQTNEAMVMYFSLPVQEQILSFATNAEVLQEGIQKLQAMPEDQRQKTLDGFNQFFSFTPAEKEKILTTLSEPERQQLQRILRQYENMPSSQREICVRSFEKFAGMSLEERQQFLQNAERWKMMTPKERQDWKDLVENLSSLPPSPDGLVLRSQRPGPPPLKRLP